LRKRDVRGEKGLEKHRDGTELGMIFPHALTVCSSIIMIGMRGTKRLQFMGTEVSM